MQDVAGDQRQFVDHGGCRGNQVQVVFALQPFLDDFHVQHAKEAYPETKAQRVGRLRLIEQGGIIQGQLGQRITEIFIVIRAHREHTRVDLRLDVLEARQGRYIGGFRQGQGVPHWGTVNILDAAAHPAHFAGFQQFGLGAFGSEDPQAVDHMGLPGGFHQNLVTFFQAAFFHPHQRDHAHVIIEPGIDNQSLQVRFAFAFRGGNTLDQLLQQIIHTHAGLGRHPTSIMGIQADNFLDLVDHHFRLGLGQVDLVQNRQHFQVLFNGGVAVGHGLGFHTLGSVHHQQRPFTGRQGAGDLVGKIHVARRINKIQLVGFAITGLVVQGHTLGLDGNASFPLQLHGIQHLRLQLTVTKAAANLDKAVCQRGFAMVDMGNDGKVADILDVSHKAC